MDNFFVHLFAMQKGVLTSSLSIMSQEEGIMFWVCFPWEAHGFLAPMKENLNATAYNDILVCFQLSWQHFEEGPLLFQHDNATMPKMSIEKWFS